MKKYDVVALGELLIDFTENGVSEQGNPLFEANPGGAPCNVLAILTKLGHKTSFIGKVGKDFFGEQLRCAIISMDPNLRPILWKDLEEAREQVLYGLGHCQILKISDNEIQWLTGESDYTAGVHWIQSRFDISLILVTLGKEGSRAYYQGKMVEAAPFLRQNTIETTGAGDTFCGCMLSYILEHGLDDLKEENLMEMLTFANCAASLITTKKGALRVMPAKEEIEEEIQRAHKEMYQ